MAHIAPVTPSTAKVPTISTFSLKTCTNLASHCRISKVWACSSNGSVESSQGKNRVQRRNLALGLAGVALGLSVGGGNARAAARRPPPPPPEEKKDPSISGLAAKVLASKKRKEAFKDSITKLREKGKAIQEEPSK